MLMENIKEHENSEINTDELVVILLTTRLSDKDTLTTIGFREFYKFFNWIQASKYKLRDLLDESTLKYILDVYSIQIYKLLSSSRKAYLLKKIKEWDKNGIKVITFLNKKYPQTLKNKLHSPTVLFAYGNTNYLNEKHISIQGEDYPDKQSENQLKINEISRTLGKFTALNKSLLFYNLFSFVNKNVMYGTNQSDRKTSTVIISSGIFKYLEKYPNYSMLIKKNRLCFISFWYPEKVSDDSTKRYASKIFNIFTKEKYIVHISDDEDIRKLKLISYLKDKSNILYVRPGIYKESLFKSLGSKLFVISKRNSDGY